MIQNFLKLCSTFLLVIYARACQVGFFYLFFPIPFKWEQFFELMFLSWMDILKFTVIVEVAVKVTERFAPEADKKKVRRYFYGISAIIIPILAYAYWRFK